MADPAVALSLRTDGADPAARDLALRNVVAITVRPGFTPADLAMLRIVPDAPSPTPSRDRVVKRAKPASGRNTIRQRFLAEATRELYERLGEADRRVEDGSVILRWDLGVGDGILVARKSTEEARNGETIGAQIQASVDYCDVAGHKPRIVVAVLNLSGQAHFENRHDFTEVFEAFVRGEASWVVYRGMDRVARSVAWTALFVHYLREYGIGLHIAQLHKEVDLNNAFEVAQLWMLAAGAELEAASSRERMLTAMSSQMRDAGKGWGLSGGFGFTRDEQKFIVVDDSQWPYVILIHEMYGSLRSVSAVMRTLESEHNLRLSRATIHKILRDERYVTGTIKTKDPKSPAGFREDTIHLPHPVARPLWEHNQTLLAAKRGKTTRTPEAQFVTRGIPVYHARCMDTEDPTRSANRLSSKQSKSGEYRFFHAAADKSVRAGYRTPECCRGYTLAVDVVERAVIRGVLAMLEGSDELHRAIALGRANREPLEGGGIFTSDDRVRMNREIRRLERIRDGLWERHVQRLKAGKPPVRDFLEQELTIVDDELTSMRRQLEIDAQLRGREPRATPLPDEVRELLTLEAPSDPEMRLRRWAIVNQLVSRVVVIDTDAGLSVEIFGPLVPPNRNLNEWDPREAYAVATGSPAARPEVPQPFRTGPIPERLVPAYRWRCDLDHVPSGWLTLASVISALREIAAEHPTGPICGSSRRGAERWMSFARQHKIAEHWSVVDGVARANGMTRSQLVRDAVGDREAVTKGRLDVSSQSDAVWVLEEAIRDGFDYGFGWSVRARAFGADKPYAFTSPSLYAWAGRFAGGDMAALIAQAQALAARRDA